MKNWSVGRFRKFISQVHRAQDQDQLIMKSKSKKKKIKECQQKYVKTGCYVCKNGCVDTKVPKVICRISSGRVTRSYSRLMSDLNDEFIIIEAYRCMPLLGDEQEIAPNWDVHIVRYCIIFKRNIDFFGYSLNKDS